MEDLKKLITDLAGIAAKAEPPRTDTTDNRRSLCFVLGAQAEGCEGPRLDGEGSSLTPDLSQLSTGVHISLMAASQDVRGGFGFEQLCGFYADAAAHLVKSRANTILLYRFLIETHQGTTGSWITENWVASAARYAARVTPEVLDCLPEHLKDWLMQQLPEDQLWMYRMDGFRVRPAESAGPDTGEFMCKPCWMKLADTIYDRGSW